MDFRQLEIFLAVVETGSFSRAGERVFASQPTVTMQMKSLEEELSQQLLERSTQGVRVTPAGQRVYDYAAATLRERDRLFTEFGRSNPRTTHVGVAVRKLGLVDRKKAKLFGLVKEFYDFVLDTAPKLS